MKSLPFKKQLNYIWTPITDTLNKRKTKNNKNLYLIYKKVCNDIYYQFLQYISSWITFPVFSGNYYPLILFIISKGFIGSILKVLFVFDKSCILE